ncbi:hypothetical protein BAJUN_01460 [Bajunvirus bajun]|uniref:NADAR domain-containing protein n=1 Tax=Brevundimonas phage vB_BgoS-Bajun TaxID=2948594 RepID=A0A9E7N7P0_9CAUD|nr:hypothetical protein BAJUN_01460 [Brevundimonas phage vB_BgoS-Bajun]
MTEPILEFRGKTRWLSNFHLVTVVHEGITYPSTEHAYQAAKTLDMSERQRIADLEKPGDAMRVGRALKSRTDWPDVKVRIMYEVNREKYRPGSELAAMLLATGDAHLEEGNHHGDRFWGTVYGKGRNELGKVLMRIRDELRALR